MGCFILIVTIILCCIFPDAWGAIIFFSIILWMIIYIFNQVESDKTTELQTAKQQRQYEEQQRQYEEYVKKLMHKYGNKNIVDKILRNEIWVGQTQEMLIDSLGQPEYVQKNQLKNKYKEIWNYNRVGKGRYSISITLEDQVVVGYRI